MEGNGGSTRVAPGRAWVIGGALFLASVVIGVGTLPMVAVIAGGSILATLLFSAALVVFAIGSHGRGSVTARRPLGTIALCVLAVWSPAVSIIEGAALGDTPYGSLRTIGYVDNAVQFTLALIAVVQIVRAGVVPRPWAWLPAVVLGLLTVLWLVEQLPVAQTDPALATVLTTAEGLVRVGAPVVFGVVAIVLANKLPAIPPEARTAHPSRMREVSS